MMSFGPPQCIRRWWITRTRQMLYSNGRRTRSLGATRHSCSTKHASIMGGITSWTPTGWPRLRSSNRRFAAYALHGVRVAGARTGARGASDAHRNADADDVDIGWRFDLRG